MVSVEKSLVWPQEAVFTLLQKVREREVLWNIKYKDYPKNVRRAMFEEVGMELKEEYPSLEHLTTGNRLINNIMLKWSWQGYYYQIMIMYVN